MARFGTMQFDRLDAALRDQQRLIDGPQTDAFFIAMDRAREDAERERQEQASAQLFRDLIAGSGGGFAGSDDLVAEPAMGPPVEPPQPQYDVPPAGSIMGIDPETFARQGYNNQSQILGELFRREGEARETVKDQADRQAMEILRQRNAQAYRKMLEQTGLPPDSPQARQAAMQLGLYEEGVVDDLPSLSPMDFARGMGQVGGGGGQGYSRHDVEAYFDAISQADELEQSAQLMDDVMPDRAAAIRGQAQMMRRRAAVLGAMLPPEVRAQAGGAGLDPYGGDGGMGHDPRPMIGEMQNSVQRQSVDLSRVMQAIASSPDLIQQIGRPDSPGYEERLERMAELLTRVGSGG